MRRTASVGARAEHFDEERGCLRVPSPKGGESRAVDLPLSGALLYLLRRRIEGKPIIDADSPWLFPSDSASGYVAEIRTNVLGGLSDTPRGTCMRRSRSKPVCRSQNSDSFLTTR
jgi:hypothetical protein